MSFTEVDLAAAHVYASQRLRLLHLNYLYEHAPHLLTHVKYRIRQADRTKDYYFTEGFRRKAIMVDVDVTKTMCEMMSCVSQTPTGVCGEKDSAKVFRAGTDQFVTTCQPACFNMNNVIEYSDDKEPKPQSVPFEWDTRQNVCKMVSPMASFMDFPLLRSKETYEMRVNDLPLGFNRVPDTRFQRGFGYTFNEPYCEAFFDVWDPQRGECVESTRDFILGAVFGSSLVKYVQEGIRLLTNGLHEYAPLPSNLPPIPQPKEVFNRTNWLRNVVEEFVNPSPYAEAPVDPTEPSGERNHKRAKPARLYYLDETGKQTEYTEQQLEELEKARRSQRFYLSLRIQKTKEDQKQKTKNKTDKDDQQEKLLPKPVISNLEAADTNPTTDSLILSTLQDFRMEHEVLSSILLSIGIDQAIGFTKNRALALIDKTSTTLVKNIGLLGNRVFSSKILQNTLERTLTFSTRRTLTSSIGMAAKGLTKLLRVGFSTFNIVQWITVALDLLFYFWDPAGFNKKYSREQLDNILFSIESNLRAELDRRDPTVEFEDLLFFLVPENAQMELSLQVFPFVYEYLDSLEVNSEGTRIDKGVPIGNMTEDLTEHTQNLAERDQKIYTQEDLENYEHDHKLRMNWFRINVPIVIALTAIGTMFLFTGFALSGVLLLILAIVFVFTMYLNTTINMGRYWQTISDEIKLIMKINKN